MNAGRFEITEHLSKPGGSGNEDVFGSVIKDNQLDLWVIDGATSIADQEHLGVPISDPAWFAQAISDNIQHAIEDGATPPQSVRQAVQKVAVDYETRTAGKNIPLAEKPMAALGWLRAIAQPGQTVLNLWSLGDTRFLIGQGDQIISFPSLERRELAIPRKSDENDERSRTGVLLSIIDGEKAARVRKHTDPSASRLGFHPDSIDFAERQEIILRGAFNILAMSDGFYRLVDEYKLYDNLSLIRAAQDGLEPLYQQLRAYEDAAEKRKDHSIKRRDDATAIFIHFNAEP